MSERTGKMFFKEWATLLTAGVMMLAVYAVADSGSQAAKPAAETSATPAGNETPADKVPAKLIACYFHGTVRCVTCLGIERDARQMVYQTFLEPLSQGLMEWRSVNYDNDPGAALAKPFNLSIPSLVLIHEGGDGKILASKNLEQIWELAGDPTKLREYIQSEILTMLGPVRPPAAPGH